MDASDEPTHPFERRRILELGRASATTRVNRESEFIESRQRGATGERKRGDDRDLQLGELRDEGMLLGDLPNGPALRPVELGDHRRSARGKAGRRCAVVEPDLVNAVLVAVEREEAAVAGEADAG